MIRIELGQVAPKENMRPFLPPRQLDVLRHMALGQSNKQIARALDVSKETVKSHISNDEDGILQRLGAVDRLNAVLNGIAGGQLDLEKLTQGYDFGRFPVFAPRELDVLEETVRDTGQFSSSKEIALRLKISPQTVKNRFVSIFNKFDLYGVDNKVRAAVFFVAWKEKLREEEEHTYSGA